MKTNLYKTRLIIVLLLINWGCAAKPQIRKPARPVFFPPPPETPRIQFLTSISRENDYIVPKGSFADFIIGKKRQAEKEVNKPYGVSIKDGIIYVCDTELNTIHVLDVPGQ